MKKLIIVLLTLLFSAGICQADWEITVKDWTMSPGPDLAYEYVAIDGDDGNDMIEWVVRDCIGNANKGKIFPADPKECTFKLIDSRAEQNIYILSFDSAGNKAKHTLGNIGSGPSPASGGSVLQVWNNSVNKWDVKVNWVMSPGPGLSYEQIWLNDKVIENCSNFKSEDPKECNFQVDMKSNEEINVVSFDMDNKNETYKISNLAGPNPAHGGSINLIWKP